MKRIFLDRARRVLPYFVSMTAILGSAQSIAAPPVYQCGEGATLRYSDTPCSPGQAPLAVAEPTPMAAPSKIERAQAKQLDASENASRVARDKADAAWVTAHQAEVANAKRLRDAEMENRVVKGMTQDQVERILNEPTRVEQSGDVVHWVYQNGRERRTIAFRDGVVVGDASSTRRH